MNIVLSNRHQKAINIAYDEALKVNDSAHRLGSVIVSGGKIVSTGRNSLRAKLGNNILCSVHAEISALHNLFKNRDYVWDTDRVERSECQESHSRNDIETGWYVQ